MWGRILGVILWEDPLGGAFLEGPLEGGAPVGDPVKVVLLGRRG